MVVYFLNTKHMNILSIVYIFLMYFSSLSCSKDVYPKTIPPEARYDKRTNSYVYIANGKKKVWNENGELFSEESLDEVGRSHGLYQSFFPSTGALLSRGNFKNGEREGVWEWYFPNGRIYYRSGYSSEKKRQVWIETNLLGNEHGLHERYYSSGNLEERGSFEFGLKTGVWEKFYKNGNFEHGGRYKSDKKVGKWLYLYPDGKKVAGEEFDESGKFLNRSTFYPDGSPECTTLVDKTECKKILQ